jgi:transcriptional regulator with XRE-family HTH domain
MAQETRGERLGQAMALRGWRKHAALAKALGIDASTVSRWRRDGPLSLEHAMALCEHLDVSLDWLLLGRGTPEWRRHASPEVEALGNRARLALTRFTSALPELFGADGDRG